MKGTAKTKGIEITAAVLFTAALLARQVVESDGKRA